jgi:pimeloyl-ACP methyl ester carboxylesterase
VTESTDLGKPPIAVDHFEVMTSVGRLTIYVTGVGTPLLLIHSINAAASAAEVAPLIERYEGSRQVFSLDLPGYGLSERSDRIYTPRMMTDAILHVAGLIRDRNTNRIDALALSLSCEFLARAASEQPELFRSLALVSPTGFSSRKILRGAPGTTRFKPWLYALLNGPGSGWGRAIFRQLTRPGVIRYFLRRTWGSSQIDERLWRADIRMAQWPGAQYAPLYFLSGGLFSADIQTIYEQLRMPVWLCHGTRGDFTDYGRADLVAQRDNWTVTVFETGALPFFEVPDAFSVAYDAFLRVTD